MSRVFISIKQLVCSCFHILQDGFLRWTRPLNTSLLLGTLADLARGKSERVAENALLRQQLIILRRQSKRPVCTKRDRILLVLLAKAVRAWRQALLIVQPETLLMWHRQGFRLFWKQKSKTTSTQAKVKAETIALITEMARNNRLWGAERIRGELLKLGIRVCLPHDPKVHATCAPASIMGTELENFSPQSCRRNLGLRFPPGD